MNITESLAEIVGPKHVLLGGGTATYAKDATGKYIGQPMAVVRPANTEEVSRIVRLAYDTGTPVVPIGGNTGLVGGTFNENGVMISLDRLNTIFDIRPDSRVAIVGAGVVLSKLHEAAEQHGLTFPLFFGARGSAMIGGNLATNAGGSNVLRYGNTRALCLGLEVVLPSGEIMDLKSALHKDNTGYDLKDLFIGSEGTLGIITGAVLKLVPKPRSYATAMVSVRTVDDALALLNRLQDASAGMVEAFEYMPKTYMQRMAVARPDLSVPLGHDREVTLLVELGATAARDAQQGEDGATVVQHLLNDVLAEMVDAGLVEDAVVATSNAQRTKMWQLRELAAEITLSRHPIVDMDIALPLDRLQEFVDRIGPEMARLDAGAETITVGHLGDGNLHFSVWPSRDDAALHDQIRQVADQLAVDLGGSFSAEHGVGLTKQASMQAMKDPVALDVMRQIKAALDPKNIMNPGKVLP